jgi:hypothetical protein
MKNNPIIIIISGICFLIGILLIASFGSVKTGEKYSWLAGGYRDTYRPTPGTIIGLILFALGGILLLATL